MTAARDPFSEVLPSLAERLAAIEVEYNRRHSLLDVDAQTYSAAESRLDAWRHRERGKAHLVLSTPTLIAEFEAVADALDEGAPRDLTIDRVWLFGGVSAEPPPHERVAARAAIGLVCKPQQSLTADTARQCAALLRAAARRPGVLLDGPA